MTATGSHAWVVPPASNTAAFEIDLDADTSGNYDEENCVNIWLTANGTVDFGLAYGGNGQNLLLREFPVCERDSQRLVHAEWNIVPVGEWDHGRMLFRYSTP